MNPSGTPAVLSESIDTAPSSDNQRIEELLTATRLAQPELANEKENSQANTIPDECTTHNEMSQTLAEVIATTEAQRGNTTKEHLRPADNGHDLANDTVCQHEDPTDTTLSCFLEVQLKISAQYDLHDQHEHQPVCERGVEVFVELAALVCVAEEVSQNSDDSADDLNGNVPARANDLESVC